jgi:hypothetical protein
VSERNAGHRGPWQGRRSQKDGRARPESYDYRVLQAPTSGGCQTQGHEQKKDRNLARGCSGKEPIPTTQPADREKEKEEKETNTTAVKRA